MFARLLRVIILSLSAITFINAQQITPAGFNSVISKNRVVIVKFWAKWCVPCSVLTPEFDKAKAAMGKKVKFVEYNVDLRGKPLQKYNIEFVPTMVIFKNGKEVSRNSDILDSSAIVEWVAKYAN